MSVVDDGTHSWGGLRGNLVLAPSFTFSDTIHADHVIFLWYMEGKDFALSLHAWEPFAQSVATLEEMVASVPVTDA